MYDPEYAWEVWQWMEGFEWKFLPHAGGLLDQDERLMHDLFVISWRKRWLKETGGQIELPPGVVVKRARRVGSPTKE